MRRVILALALLALALPMAAWANTITIDNQGGTVNISNLFGTNDLGTIGATTIASHGSVLTSFDGLTGTQGRVIFDTGALLSGTVAGGGTFSASGSTFEVLAFGAWLKGLNPPASGTTALFSGTFSGPITWTFDGTVGKEQTYTLSGYITGTLYNGQTVSGYTTQNIYTIDGKYIDSIGHITFGTTNVVTPEPGTLGLLGTGLVGLAGVFRRKFMRS